MAISEAARTNLYNGLREVLGPENAETLMSVVSLHDLDEVATKRDLAEIRAEVAAMRAEILTELHREVGSLRKTMTNWMLTVLVTVIGAMVSLALIV